MTMEKDKEVKVTQCEVCEKDVKETYRCERCDRMYCDNCGATYDQFTQIDYNCCKSCAERNID